MPDEGLPAGKNTPRKPISLDLDAEQVAAFLSALRQVTNNRPSLTCLRPVLDTISKAYSDAMVSKPRQIIPTMPATIFRSTSAAARSLGVDFKDEDPNYVLDLNSVYGYPHNSLEVLGVVFENFRMSDGVSTKHDLPLNQVVLDLILMGRLPSYERIALYDRLLISTDVSLRVVVKDTYGNELIITSKVDWAIGFGRDKCTYDDAILLILKAKPHENEPVGLPQLLVSMSAVHSNAGRKVFGILSDGEEFLFAFLNDKFCVSRPFTAAAKRTHILAYIDMALSDVMLDCDILADDQNTVPRKISKAAVNDCSRFNFEDVRDDKEANELKTEDCEMIDLVLCSFPNGQVVFKSVNLLQ